MGKIKLFFKKNPITKTVYGMLKEKNDERIRKSFFAWHGTFHNRSNNSKSLLIVLAGYKEYLYDCVFDRVRNNLENGFDVCIVSSGLYSEKLDELCKQHNWSYLSTKENNVGLVQNVAINLHPNAEYIYKLDEDIFITEDYFSKMRKALEHAENGRYNPGVIAPHLLVNGFCTPRIIDRLGLNDEFVKRFGSNRFVAGAGSQVEENPEIAKFMWGNENIVPDIDIINNEFAGDETSEDPCPIRFSIGAILFRRSLWEQMGYFDTKHKNGGMMGKDEEKICKYCLIMSRPIMVSNNIVVGHFSFRLQTEAMKQYYFEHPERFVR